MWKILHSLLYSRGVSLCIPLPDWKRYPCIKLTHPFLFPSSCDWVRYGGVLQDLTKRSFGSGKKLIVLDVKNQSQTSQVLPPPPAQTQPYCGSYPYSWCPNPLVCRSLATLRFKPTLTSDSEYFSFGCLSHWTLFQPCSSYSVSTRVVYGSVLLIITISMQQGAPNQGPYS